MSEKIVCNCSASNPEVQFPGVHATDCPEFLATRRRASSNDENQSEAPLPVTEITPDVDEIGAIVEGLLGDMLGPRRRELPRMPGLPGLPFHGMTAMPKLINGTTLVTLLTAAVELLEDDDGSHIASACNLIKLALDEITPRKAL
jgi:hypothetical protein